MSNKHSNIPEGEAGRIVGDDIKYNQVALKSMQKLGIAVNDLHALTKQFEPEMYSKPGDVHFSGKGNAKLAELVAEAVRRFIQCRGSLTAHCSKFCKVGSMASAHMR